MRCKGEGSRARICNLSFALCGDNCMNCEVAESWRHLAAAAVMRTLATVAALTLQLCVHQCCKRSIGFTVGFHNHREVVEAFSVIVKTSPINCLQLLARSAV